MGGKKKGEAGLGRSVIKDRFQAKPHKTSSFLHTSELTDGYEWGRLNLQSVTEQSNLDDFLATAELAGTEFTAEKLNVRFVNPSQRESHVLNHELRDRVTAAQDEHRAMLKIPRRPKWDVMTSPEVLDRMEKDAFLDWRRQLSELQEKDHIILTPFEKNLEFWRQLWRVIERSDVVVQIVDARNPLLFRCEDLEAYVKEVSQEKLNVILVNKADYLTDKQRKYWFDYFTSEGIHVVFWSAVNETERLKREELEARLTDEDSSDVSSSSLTSSDDEDDHNGNGENSNTTETITISETKTETETVDNVSETVENESETAENETGTVKKTEDSETASYAAEIADRLGQTSLNPVEEELTKWRLLNGEELTQVWKELHEGVKVTTGVTTVGLVGYPNVGKSSTINAVLKTKKVPVSATPGRTKHFQTLYLEEDLLLCDCPGLVMPSFVSTKAAMVVSGILPIDQMRDYLPPTSLVCELIPRDIMEMTYGVNIPPPGEGEDPSRPPTAHELLATYGYMRGFMTHKGLPDMPRSSRIILKDFVNGKLLYRYPPPGIQDEDYEPTSFPDVQRKMKSKSSEEKSEKRVPTSSIDKAFFTKVQQEVHSKGVPAVPPGVMAASREGLTNKPWKKHGNKGKKEKLRRTFAHREN